MADDWTAVRLRGGVFALENGAWTQLVRGSVVPDDRVIKSAPGGRMTLVRGAETIELGPETTAQISDRAGFTTVYNHEGTVGIDAEARNVKHFAVQTPFLAAVVKGTAFTVQSNTTTSTVTVARGTVEVADEQGNTRVDVEAGEQVSTTQDIPITIQSVVAAPANAPKPPAPAALQPQPGGVDAPTASSTARVGSGQDNSGTGNASNDNSGKSNRESSGSGPGGKGPGTGGNGPGGNGPGGNGPGGSGPGGSGPGGNGPGGGGPGGNGPGGNGPGGNGPGGNGPGGNGPGGNGPGGDGPGDKGPGGKGPGDNGRGSDEHGDKGPGDKGPDDKGPGGDGPGGKGRDR